MCTALENGELTPARLNDLSVSGVFHNEVMPMSKSSIEPRAFRLPEFQKRNAIGKDATYEEIRRGRLKARKRGRSTIILAEDEAEWRANLPLLSFASSLEKLVCRAVNLFSPTPLDPVRNPCAPLRRRDGDHVGGTKQEQRGIMVGVSPVL
jgi:hypothetical protein